MFNILATVLSCGKPRSESCFHNFCQNSCFHNTCFNGVNGFKRSKIVRDLEVNPLSQLTSKSVNK